MKLKLHLLSNDFPTLSGTFDSFFKMMLSKQQGPTV